MVLLNNDMVLLNEGCLGTVFRWKLRVFGVGYGKTGFRLSRFMSLLGKIEGKSHNFVSVLSYLRASPRKTAMN